MCHSNLSPARESTKTPWPWLLAEVSMGLARPWTSDSTSKASLATSSSITLPPFKVFKAARRDVEMAAEDPIPEPEGMLEWVSTHKGAPLHCAVMAL
jgi:hypothetical protein